MGLKELVGQVGEDMKELIENSRRFGVEEALFQWHLESRYPQVKLLTPEGTVITEGLLMRMKGGNYSIRTRLEHGYGYGGGELGKNVISTTDNIRVTPEIFRELVDGKAGEGYLDDLETRKETLMQSILQSLEISKETRERLTGMIEDARNKRA